MKHIIKNLGKSLLLFSLPAVCGVGGSLTSCSDMLEQESDLVMYEKNNQLTSVNDTMFSVMGILSLVQQVADRSNLLGEVRGDLTSITEDANADLVDLANFTSDVDNQYNNPKDYYAIINNCNYFIENADPDYKKQGESVFERELAAVHAFRAWTYLQLCMCYDNEGKIPFYPHFVNTQKEADRLMEEGWTSKLDIYNYLIDDLEPWVNAKPLQYGTMVEIRSQRFFIPVRVILGELCLWAGRYAEAAKHLHDYLNDENDPKPMFTYNDSRGWSNKVLPESNNNSLRMSSSNQAITTIPMQSKSTDGITTQLKDLYNSTEENYFHFQLTVSEKELETSEKQEYWYFYKDQSNKKIPSTMAEIKWVDRLLNGDLRLWYNFEKRSAGSRESNLWNTTYQTNLKVPSKADYVTLYRLPYIYLLYAEALNRANFPSAAFAVLKYGICEDNMSLMDSAYVDFADFKAAGDLVSFNPYYFDNEDTDSNEDEWILIAGLHARGCGDPIADANYRIPALSTRQDTIEYVEDLIMEEAALETVFDGKRFNDLMRVALRRGKTEYLADHVSKRNGSSNQDMDLFERLKDSKNWYLPLKK